jgi:hypothetical protein
MHERDYATTGHNRDGKDDLISLLIV